MRKGRMKRMKDRLGANGPGLTVAVIAMILALAGGAFAASGALTGKQKKEVEKIAKKSAGKPGKAGATGAQGPKGDPGANGTNGANGISVVASPEPTATANCAGRGGSKFVTGTTTTYACNGKEGGTAGGTLPPGEMETGTWAYTGNTADEKGIHIALSFPIPLEKALLPNQVHYEEDADFSTFCGTPGLPRPKSAGQLCVYRNPGESPEEITFEAICNPVTGQVAFTCAEEGESKGAAATGAILAFSKPTGQSSGSGIFAVRAPEAP